MHVIYIQTYAAGTSQPEQYGVLGLKKWLVTYIYIYKLHLMIHQFDFYLRPQRFEFVSGKAFLLASGSPVVLMKH